VEIFTHATVKADIALVEGVMGLYDGLNGLTATGSTAEVAKWIQAPVVLVVDVEKISGSAAAISLGYRSLDPELNLAGVILNGVGSPSHLRSATEAVEKRANLPVLGYLPKKAELILPERHLGLVPVYEKEEKSEWLEKIAGQVESTIDVAAIIDLARKAKPLSEVEATLFSRKESSKRVPMAIAQDEAFGFYYPDNLDLLTHFGASLRPVSPLHDDELPSDIRGIYIGGGFPELYARELESNTEFKKSLGEAARAGIPVYAECGGLMYISQGMVNFEGDEHVMVGLVPGWARMQRGRMRMGYVVAQTLGDSILALRGQVLRGHLFHWSAMPEPHDNAAYRILEPREQLEGFIRGPKSNILGSYLHLHFGSDPQLARRFVDACADIVH
jgi:cobyrinic acid a,c-diamide synthase